MPGLTTVLGVRSNQPYVIWYSAWLYWGLVSWLAAKSQKVSHLVRKNMPQ